VLCAIERLTRQAGAEVERWIIGGDFQEAVRAAGGNREAAAIRIAHGAQLEEYARVTIANVWPVDRSALPDDAIARKWACQLYFDAYCAAVWTSAHAEYMAALDSDIFDPPPPSINSVPCASSGFDLSDLYARRVAPKGEGYPKAVEPLVQLLSRCTNPGARGWDTVLKDALEHQGSRAVVMHAVHTCLVGLHPQLHPEMRPSWATRARILRVMPQTGNEIKAVATHSKEAVRRCLASIMASTPAMHTALSLAGHPVRHLLQPPAQFPHVGMEAAMTTYVEAGVMMTRGSQWPYALLRAFDIRSDDGPGDPDDERLSGLMWNSGWLGKGTADVHARQPLVSVAGDVWAAGFKAHFVAFWLFAQSHQLRVSRLDATQHAAVHGLNKATQLAAQLDVDTALAVQRAVLRNPAAGILTLGEVAAELGIDGIPLVTSGVGARSAIEGVKLIGDAGPEAASKLLSYARAAWVNEEVLVVNLGSRTRALQLVALRKRLRLPEDTPETQLPMHATHVCCCAECRRVANAYATSTSSVAFNELGISSCQIATDCDPGGVRLHCAKRSSAALRTAVAFETEMKRRCVEMETVERTQLTGLTTPRRATGVESGIAARVRRDAKNALEQRVSAVACGEHPMFTIPVVGRAVCVYKQWFALCSYCATLTRVQPGVHVYGADVCCMRCDHGMLGVDNLTAGPLAAQSSGKVCRYCGCGNLLRPRTLPCAPSIACYPLQLYTHNTGGERIAPCTRPLGAQPHQFVVGGKRYRSLHVLNVPLSKDVGRAPATLDVFFTGRVVHCSSNTMAYVPKAWSIPMVAACHTGVKRGGQMCKELIGGPELRVGRKSCRTQTVASRHLPHSDSDAVHQLSTWFCQPLLARLCLRLGITAIKYSRQTCFLRGGLTHRCAGTTNLSCLAFSRLVVAELSRAVMRAPLVAIVMEDGHAPPTIIVSLAATTHTRSKVRVVNHWRLLLSSGVCFSMFGVAIDT